MMMNFLRLSFIFMSFFYFIGCNTTTHEVREAQEAADVVKAPTKSDSETSAIWSSQLVDSAERLMSINGFMYAKIFLDKALSADPENFKAALYLEILKPILLFEGFSQRTKGLLEQAPRTTDGRVIQLFDDLPMTSNFMKFLNQQTSANPINSESDFQAFIGELNRALEGLRQFLKENKRRVVTIRIVSTTDLHRAAEHCLIETISAETFRLVSCPYQYQFEASLNLADFEVLQQSTGGLQMLNSFLSAWRIDGVVNKARIVGEESTAAREAKTQISSSEMRFFDRLNRVEGFGELIRAEVFSHVKSLAADSAQAAKWFIRHSEQLCKTGSPSRANRGGYLFEAGICLDDEISVTKRTDPPVTLASDALTDLVIANLTFGTVASLPMRDGIERRADLNQFLTQPPTNAKSLFPIYDHRECAEDFVDASFGGLFPDGDAQPVLMPKSEACRN